MALPWMCSRPPSSWLVAALTALSLHTLLLPAQVCGLGACVCRAQDLQVALDTAARLLPAYEERLQVPYALPKLDLVAIPDFAAGAMENWGLITFRETDLLATNASGVLGVQRVTSVIAHEMAHLVRGNICTQRANEECSWLRLDEYAPGHCLLKHMRQCCLQSDSGVTRTIFHGKQLQYYVLEAMHVPSSSALPSQNLVCIEELQRHLP